MLSTTLHTSKLSNNSHYIYCSTENEEDGPIYVLSGPWHCSCNPVILCEKISAVGRYVDKHIVPMNDPRECRQVINVVVVEASSALHAHVFALETQCRRSDDSMSGRGSSVSAKIFLRGCVQGTFGVSSKGRTGGRGSISGAWAVDAQGINRTRAGVSDDYDVFRGNPLLILQTPQPPQ